MAIRGYMTGDLPEVTGVSLGRILWAYRTRRLPEPERLGCHRVHTPEDVQRIREYFSQADEAGRAKGGGRGRPVGAVDAGQQESTGGRTEPRKGVGAE
jgi:hypothetical protein